MQITLTSKSNIYQNSNDKAMGPIKAHDSILNNNSLSEKDNKVGDVNQEEVNCCYRQTPGNHATSPLITQT